MTKNDEGKNISGPDGSIEERWLSNNSAEEAQKLVDYMTLHPSRTWLKFMEKAEAQDIKYWNVLLDNSDKIYESIAEATSDADDIVTHD